jgi:hypothetical protein
LHYWWSIISFGAFDSVCFETVAGVESRLKLVLPPKRKSIGTFVIGAQANVTCTMGQRRYRKRQVGWQFCRTENRS